MGLFKKLVKIIIVLNFGLIVSIGLIDNASYAESVDEFGKNVEIPITSLKCNEFTFDATKSQFPKGPNITFSWNFGDGTTSEEAVITHIYEQSGDYTVNLTMTDNSGVECSTAVSSQPVRVNIPPHASFVSEDTACFNEPITLDATTSYNANRQGLDYKWNFGDGTHHEGDFKVQKIYSKGGDYKVLLTVDDRSNTLCNMQTAEKIIHINEPPVAKAGNTVIYKCMSGANDTEVHFDASATTDANNDELSYIWDFGDGQKGKGREPIHRYKGIGDYDVRLVVYDNSDLSCGTGVDFITVKLNQAPKANAGDDVLGCPGEEINFDGSNSNINKKGTAVAQWFFGDSSSSSGIYASHSYSKPGIYQATLSLENKLNTMCPISRDTSVVTINSPPTVGIINLPSGCVQKDVFFDASSAVDADGDDLIFYWNFGDGITSQSGPKVHHRYQQGGDYRVSITVDDQKGTTCSAATANVNVHINTPPVANAGPNLSCCVDKVTEFDAGVSTDPDDDRLNFTWDFGDGSQTQGEKVTHTYSKPGSYNVLLTVDDRSGSVCSQSMDGFVAVVKESLVPVINVR